MSFVGTPRSKCRDVGTVWSYMTMPSFLQEGKLFVTTGVLGRGAFGVAYCVKHKGRDYCLKEISFQDSESKQRALQEIFLMKQCDHPNILRVYESWCDDHKACIVMELASKRSLEKLIKCFSLQGKHFPRRRVLHFLQEMADALQHCHDSVNIIHRDVKPSNVLLDDIGTFKLADFGLSKHVVHALTSTFCGSPLYMAPEQLSGETRSYSFPVDMWALGCVAFEMMVLSSPWLRDTPRTYNAVVNRIVHEDVDMTEVQTRFGDRISTVVKCLMEKKADHRLTARDLLDMIQENSCYEREQKILPRNTKSVISTCGTKKNLPRTSRTDTHECTERLLKLALPKPKPPPVPFTVKRAPSPRMVRM